MQQKKIVTIKTEECGENVHHDSSIINHSIMNLLFIECTICILLVIEIYDR